jgi:hypothetical protein
MTLRIARLRRFTSYAAVIVLATLVLRTPAAQSVVTGGLVEFADMSARILRLPCWLMDHTRCFSLDRFDPTCPQCM